MAEHDDKQVPSVDAVANAEPSKGRRRLVKGAMLATPAVMTLFHGRLAMASICTGNEGSTLDVSNLNQEIILNPEADLIFYDQYDVETYTIDSAIYFSYEGMYYTSNGQSVTDSTIINLLNQATGEPNVAYKLRIDNNVAITGSCLASII